MENGNGPTEVKYTPTVKNELCDGNWHRIRVVKNGKSAALTVDDNDEINVVGGGNLQNANIFDPLYVGGVEGNLVIYIYIYFLFFVLLIVSF